MLNIFVVILFLLLAQYSYAKDLPATSSSALDINEWTAWADKGSNKNSILLTNCENMRHCLLIQSLNSRRSAAIKRFGTKKPGRIRFRVRYKIKSECVSAPQIGVKWVDNTGEKFSKHVSLNIESTWEEATVLIQSKHGYRNIVFTLNTRDVCQLLVSDVTSGYIEVTRVKLDGVWEQSNSDDIDVPENDSFWSRITIPTSLRQLLEGSRARVQSYRKKLILPDSLKNRNLVFEANGLSKKDVVFVNNIEIGRTGEFATGLSNRSKDSRKYLIPRWLISDADEVNIQINTIGLGAYGGLTNGDIFVRLANYSELYEIEFGNFDRYMDGLSESTISSTVRPRRSLQLNNADVFGYQALVDATGKIISKKEFFLKSSSATYINLNLKIPLLNEGIYYINTLLFDSENNKYQALEDESIGVLRPEKNSFSDKICLADHLNRLSKGEKEKVLFLVKQVGINCMRTGFLWKDVEATQGVWDWSRFDSTFELLEKYNIRVLPTLAMAPRWAAADPLVVSGEAHKQGGMPRLSLWENYVSLFHKRYNRRYSAIEVWNEPNLLTYMKPLPNSYDYYQLYESALSAVKANDGTQLVIGGLAENNNSSSLNALQFLEDLIKYNAVNQESLNIAYHPYPNIFKGISNNNISEDVSSQLNGVLNVARKNISSTIQLYLTEMGCPEIPFVFDELKQAECLVVSILSALKVINLKALYLYNFREGGDNDAYKEYNWGLVNFDLSPKKNLFGLYFLLKYLTDMVFIDDITTADGVVGSVFESDEKVVWVLWSSRGIDFKMPKTMLDVRSILGQKIYIENGKIELSNAPVYLFLSKE